MSTKKTDKKIKKATKKEDILLIATGSIYLDKKVKPTILHINDKTQALIDKHCIGSKRAVLNILLDIGLKALIKKNELIIFD